jgi:hypothetical protein
MKGDVLEPVGKGHKAQGRVCRGIEVKGSHEL